MTTCGFTGTQSGMTEKQMARVEKIMRYFRFSAFHMGDCVGADEQAHGIFTRISDNPTVQHPPINSAKRAFTKCAEVRPAKDYLARNRDIVDEKAAMLAAPKGMSEEQRSGTWSTIRYARRLKRPLFIVWPDGSLTYENYVYREKVDSAG